MKNRRIKIKQKGRDTVLPALLIRHLVLDLHLRHERSPAADRTVVHRIAASVWRSSAAVRRNGPVPVGLLRLLLLLLLNRGRWQTGLALRSAEAVVLDRLVRGRCVVIAGHGAGLFQLLGRRGQLLLLLLVHGNVHRRGVPGWSLGMIVMVTSTTQRAIFFWFRSKGGCCDVIFGGWFLFLLENFGRKADGEREKKTIEFWVFEAWLLYGNFWGWWGGSFVKMGLFRTFLIKPVMKAVIF